MKITGASIPVGNSLGSGNRGYGRIVILAQELMVLIIRVIVVVVLLCFPRGILALFVLEPELVPSGLVPIRFFVLFFFTEVLGYSFEIIFTQNG